MLRGSLEETVPEESWESCGCTSVDNRVQSTIHHMLYTIYYMLYTIYYILYAICYMLHDLSQNMDGANATILQAFSAPSPAVWVDSGLERRGLRCQQASSGAGGASCESSERNTLHTWAVFETKQFT